MNIKQLQEPFPPHKVTLKSATTAYPSRALNYLVTKYEYVEITVLKQRFRSITIEIRCTDSIYEVIKLDFVKDMGRDYIWKD